MPEAARMRDALLRPAGASSDFDLNPGFQPPAGRVLRPAGVLVPVIFDRLDIDPAVASSVFVTMITDSMGFFAFLGLAVAMGLATF